MAGRVALRLVRRGGEETTVTWSELERSACRAARLLGERGVDSGTLVIIALRPSVEHVVAIQAAWKLGACVLPLAPQLPQWERHQLLDVARSSGRRVIVVADWTDVDGEPVRSHALAAEGYGDDALPDRVPHPGKANASGGSTGRPKIIIDPQPLAFVPGTGMFAMLGTLGWKPGQRMLVPLPLFHSSGFFATVFGLFDGCEVMLMERFEPADATRLIETHRVEWSPLTPTHMLRLVRSKVTEGRDLSSVTIMHTAAPCPPWLKRWWVERLGPDRVFELYGGTEGNGYTRATGHDALERPGTLGRPVMTDVRIVDRQGRTCSPGQVGQIFLRLQRPGRAPSYSYVGHEPLETTDDGFSTLGDLGWLDEDGYLYLADRRVDLIVSGGVNVYPAEVEAALSEHPAVADVSVIGLADPEWGHRVHAVVEPVEWERRPDEKTLLDFARSRLVGEKLPKSIELVRDLPRAESGKIRKSLLRAERDRQAGG
jgi:bile acid-coenzyme A ligase